MSDVVNSQKTEASIGGQHELDIALKAQRVGINDLAPWVKVIVEYT
jgi:hypothetical protein